MGKASVARGEQGAKRESRRPWPPGISPSIHGEDGEICVCAFDLEVDMS